MTEEKALLIAIFMIAIFFLGHLSGEKSQPQNISQSSGGNTYFLKGW